MTDRFEDIPEHALAWHRAGRGAALATVVETWGSAPRRVGSMLAISGDGEMAGSVSGGCVEGAVVVEAMEALEDGKPRLLEYGVSDGDAFAVGLACGGTIRVLVQPVGSALPEDILASLVDERLHARLWLWSRICRSAGPVCQKTIPTVSGWIALASKKTAGPLLLSTIPRFRW